MINKNYAMSSYLSFRFIEDENINFFENLTHKVFKAKDRSEQIGVKTADDIDNVIKGVIEKEYIPNKTAILLSGGIDSAILASYLPAGTIAYTFKSIAPNAIDETAQAKKYADKYNLNHKIIEITWDDYLKLTPSILKYDGVPIHSIEVQLYKACLIAKNDGIEKFIIGESSDLVFGGMDKLLSKDWTFNEFVERYTFVNPALVLKESSSMKSTFERYRISDDKIDFLKFMDEIFSIESSSSYMHAFSFGDIKYSDPYSFMYMKDALDLNKVRNGEPKYLVRELFKKKYPEIETPNKIPMPRAVDYWLKDWSGPTRNEFRKDININSFTGDQKWLIYCLELFLNLHEKGLL